MVAARRLLVPVALLAACSPCLAADARAGRPSLSLSVAPEARLAPPKGDRVTVDPGPIPFSVRARGVEKGDRLTVRMQRPGGSVARTFALRRAARRARRSASFDPRTESGTLRLTATLSRRGARRPVARRSLTVAVVPCASVFAGLAGAGTCADGTQQPGGGRARPLKLPAAFPSSRTLRRAARSADTTCDRRAIPDQTYVLGYPAIGRCGAVAGLPPAGERTRGLMIVVASGSWTSSPMHLRSALASGSPARWNRYGYLTLVVEVTSGAPGLTNLLGAYDTMRRAFSADPRYGGAFPICLAGGSSGGHLALMAATRRPGISCTITEGTPTDLEALQGEPRALADRWFGAELREWSPIHHPTQVPTLLGHLRQDKLVPISPSDRQVRPFLETHPKAGMYLVDSPRFFERASEGFFTHALAAGARGATQRSLCGWYGAERAWLPGSPTYDPCS